MKFSLLKMRGGRGERWFNRELGVSYGWSYISSGSGAAFAKNHSSSAVYFTIKTSRHTENDIVETEIVHEKIGTARLYNDARSLAREYIRNTGKAEAIAVAEAVEINGRV